MTLVESLLELLPAGEDRRFGEIFVEHLPDASFRARHRDDRETLEGLEELDSVRALREMAKWDADGEYRPLKTAPTLKSGWITTCDDPIEFLKRLDAIYPAVFATWVAYERGDHHPTPLRDTLDRQTGMYRFAGSITDQMANQIMRETCARGCLRTIAWPIDNSCPVSRLKRPARDIPVICTEACTFAVSEARRLVKEAYDRANPPAESAAESAPSS